jgi:hypothetical protein
MNRKELDVFYQVLDIGRQQWGFSWGRWTHNRELVQLLSFGLRTEPNAEDLMKLSVRLRD